MDRTILRDMAEGVIVPGDILCRDDGRIFTLRDSLEHVAVQYAQARSVSLCWLRDTASGPTLDTTHNAYVGRLPWMLKVGRLGEIVPPIEQRRALWKAAFSASETHKQSLSEIADRRERMARLATATQQRLKRS